MENNENNMRATMQKLIEVRYNMLPDEEKEIIIEVNESPAGPVIRKLFGNLLDGLEPIKPNTGTTQETPIENQMSSLMDRAE